MSNPKSITLEGWHEGAHKIRAIKAVRRAGGLDLASGKKVIDRCVSGHAVSFEIQSSADATETAKELAQLGFVARVDDQVYRPVEGEPGSTFRDRQTGVFVPSEIRTDSEMEAIEMKGRLESGRAEKGDQLGIPLHERFLIVAEILDVSEVGNRLVLRFASEDEEDAELWKGMNLIGDELPVLPNDGTAA